MTLSYLARRFVRPGRFQPALLLALSLVVVAPRYAQCGERSDEAVRSSELFARQLETGEFAPALEAARGVASPSQRDAWLAQLAEAQAGAGQREGAFKTLAHVEDDQTRSAAIRATRETASAAGAQGGAQADFDTLIEMITTTVRPDTWEEVGGPGTISEFNNGVYVDASGVLQRAIRPPQAKGLAVARLDALKADGNTNSRRASPMRKVSLTRLEKHVQLRWAAGRQPSDEMLHLAGLEKIQYVMVYPESGDLVLAGPASDWQVDDEGRAVSRASGRPVVQLDDLVVVLRYLTAAPQATFGCSINPTQEGLARTKQFAQRSAAQPLKPASRDAWLRTLRRQMGRQSISVEGIDPRTRVARVLVEADYRMKLVGMGLEEGTADVPSYLDLIKVAPGEAPPPLEVLRWWFTLNYDAIEATKDRDAFEIVGPGVQVMSENELLTALGRRVHTGKSEPLNAEFAHRFTQNFEALAQKYPVYADLQNIFDLAMVSALIQSQQLANRVGWHMTCFLDPEQYQVALGAAPQSVDTVINHRVVNRRHIIVGVSGGVRVAPWTFVSGAGVATDSYGALQAHRAHSQAGDLPIEAWWWD